MRAYGRTPGEDRERRRRHLWLALVGSLALHAGLYASMTGRTPGIDPTGTARRAVSVLVELAVPGLGPPGAPEGAPPTIDAEDVPEAPPAPVAAPRPRRVLSGPTALVAPPRADPVPEAAPTGGVADGAEGQGTDGQSDNAFLDTLLARSTGGGAGAGGRGGAGCPDGVEGLWRARRYNRERGRWGVFTLDVRRDGSALTGTIVLHSWTGGPDDDQPPRCGPGVYEHTVRMNASGRLDGDDFRFDARDHRRTVQCMEAERFAYNLDHFRGTLRGNRILSVNNDGGWEVNSPYTFRRVACP